MLNSVDCHDSIMYGGIDNRTNGMWFGCHENGKFAIITNFRDPVNLNENLNKKSRGTVVREYLEMADVVYPDKYIQYLNHQITSFSTSPSSSVTSDGYETDVKYNSLFDPFNLILGRVSLNEGSDAYCYYSSKTQQQTSLYDGIHVVSNAYLNTSWYKTEHLKQLFIDCLHQQSSSESSIVDKDKLESDLLDVLMNQDRPACVSELPQTGLPVEQEYALSSIFIDMPEYGTLTSTILIVDRLGKAKIVEYSHRHDNSYTGYDLNKVATAAAVTSALNSSQGFIKRKDSIVSRRSFEFQFP